MGRQWYPGESRWGPGLSGVGVMKSQILYIFKNIFIEVQLIYSVVLTYAYSKVTHL